MRRSRKTALVAATLAGGLLLAACGSDDDDGGASDTTAGATTTAAGGADLAPSLKGVCPDNIVIQTDWFPEAEHGALYQMVGDNPTIDASKKVVRGPLVAGGRYDGLLARLGSATAIPAVGFAAWIERLTAARG